MPPATQVTPTQVDASVVNQTPAQPVQAPVVEPPAPEIKADNVFGQAPEAPKPQLDADGNPVVIDETVQSFVKNSVNPLNDQIQNLTRINELNDILARPEFKEIQGDREVLKQNVVDPRFANMKTEAIIYALLGPKLMMLGAKAGIQADKTSQVNANPGKVVPVQPADNNKWTGLGRQGFQDQLKKVLPGVRL